jgi:hypothetical protein
VFRGQIRKDSRWEGEKLRSWEAERMRSQLNNLNEHYKLYPSSNQHPATVLTPET